MRIDHSDTRNITCPSCGSTIQLRVDVGADISFDFEAEEVEAKRDLLTDDGCGSVQPYKTDLPNTSWFQGFFPGLDSTGAEVGWTDGRVVLFRRELPACFYKSERKPTALPESLLTVPAEAVECRPHILRGNINIQVADLEGRLLSAALARPAVDLAFWLCPEVRFFHTFSRGLNEPFYMVNLDGTLFMVAMASR